MKAPATLDEFYRMFPTERRCWEVLRSCVQAHSAFGASQLQRRSTCPADAHNAPHSIKIVMQFRSVVTATP